MQVLGHETPVGRALLADDARAAVASFAGGVAAEHLARWRAENAACSKIAFTYYTQLLPNTDGPRAAPPPGS